MHAGMDIWMDGWMDGRMDGCRHVEKIDWQVGR